MKSITLVLMICIFVSYVFDLANAQLGTLTASPEGDANTDVSPPKRSNEKNKYTEQVCKQNNYNKHYVAYSCVAYCYESTIKNKGPIYVNLPNGAPCHSGQTCTDGYCGDIEAKNNRILKQLADFIDKSETLKNLSPPFIGAIKAELRKFKPTGRGQLHPFIVDLFKGFNGYRHIYES